MAEKTTTDEMPLFDEPPIGRGSNYKIHEIARVRFRSEPHRDPLRHDGTTLNVIGFSSDGSKIYHARNYFDVGDGAFLSIPGEDNHPIRTNRVDSYIIIDPLSGKGKIGQQRKMSDFGELVD